MLNDAGIELEAGRFEAFATPRMAGVEDRHVVLLRHLIDRRKERREVLLRIDILFTVRGEEDVFSLRQSEPSVNVRRFDRRQIFRQHLGHRRAGHVGAFFGQPAVGEVPSRMFGVCEVHVANDIDDAAVRLFRQTFVFAAVARLHMEDRDMEPFRADHGETTVRIAEDEDGVGLEFDHRLIARRDNIAHRFAEVGADRVQIQFRIGESEIFKEDAVERIVVILTGMDQNRIEILPRLLNNGGEPNNLRPRPDDNHQFDLSVLLPRRHKKVPLIAEGGFCYVLPHMRIFSLRVAELAFNVALCVWKATNGSGNFTRAR